MLFATDGGARMIVSVDVTNNGSDGGQMSPMHEAVCETYDKTPTNYVVDGGFSTIDDITVVEERGRRVAAPRTHEDRITKRGGTPHARRARDTDAMFAFRQRMKTEDSKAILKQRPSIAEFPNPFCQPRSAPVPSPQLGKGANRHALVRDHVQLDENVAPGHPLTNPSSFSRDHQESTSSTETEPRPATTKVPSPETNTNRVTNPISQKSLSGKMNRDRFQKNSQPLRVRLTQTTHTSRPIGSPVGSSAER